MPKIINVQPILQKCISSLQNNFSEFSENYIIFSGKRRSVLSALRRRQYFNGVFTLAKTEPETDNYIVCVGKQTSVKSPKLNFTVTKIDI